MIPHVTRFYEEQNRFLTTLGDNLFYQSNDLVLAKVDGNGHASVEGEVLKMEDELDFLVLFLQENTDSGVTGVAQLKELIKSGEIVSELLN